MPLSIVVADLTTLDADALVNAAAPSLLGGGGVDGALHRAAGPRLLEACRGLPEVAPGVRCPTGEARLTPGFALRARWVLHTVGPVWHGGDRDEARLLACCHDACFALAKERGLRSIAFPAISCGVYGYPHPQAAAIALERVQAALRQQPALAVTLCAFQPAMAMHWRAAAAACRVPIREG